METLKEMQQRHHKEYEQLRRKCPHNEVEIQDGTAYGGFGRNISLICKLCGEPIVGWEGREGYGRGQVLYAKGYTKVKEGK